MSSREAWDREASSWIRWARTSGHDHWYWDLNLPEFLKLLPPPPGRVLDVGCGEGRLLEEMFGRGFEVVGIDSSITLVAAAAEHAPVSQGDASRLPLGDDQVDLVTMFMTLQDFDDPDAALLEAARVLRHGGRLVAALLHPINTAGRFATKAADSAFLIEESYFEHRLRDELFGRDGIEMRFVQFHRPLEAYFGALERAGFVVDALREIRPDEAFLARHPRAARWNQVPIFMHLLCTLTSQPCQTVGRFSPSR